MGFTLKSLFLCLSCCSSFPSFSRFLTWFWLFNMHCWLRAQSLPHLLHARGGVCSRDANFFQANVHFLKGLGHFLCMADAGNSSLPVTEEVSTWPSSWLVFLVWLVDDKDLFCLWLRNPPRLVLFARSHAARRQARRRRLFSPAYVLIYLFLFVYIPH